MLSKKKKIIVLCGMVALLVVTGVLNIVLNNVGPVEDVGGGTQHLTLFQSYRADRQATRDQQLLTLDHIIRSEASSAAAIEAAEAQRLQITRTMDYELALENLIRTIGFSDAFITMGTQNINVIVRAETLTEDEANRILSIIVDETGRSAQHVIVIPLAVGNN